MAVRTLGTVAIAALLSSTLLSCAAAPRVPTDAEIEAMYRPIEGGVLATAGVVIYGDDFQISEGRFESPFQMRMAPIRWSVIFGPRNVQGQPFRNPPLTEAYEMALRQGARRVRVVYPGLSEPLFGVLQLNKAFNTATGPASRTYRIVVPDQYVRAASNARVSVVFEPMTRPDGEQYAWVLWLSDYPVF